MSTKLFRLTFLLLALLVVAFVGRSAFAQVTSGLPLTAQSQIAALADEKASRTPVQQKIDSQLIYAIKQSSPDWAAKGLPTLEVALQRGQDGSILVDIKATVDNALLNLIVANSGSIVVQVPQFQAIRAWVPLAAVETIAASPNVKFIAPAAEAELVRSPQNKELSQALREQLQAFVENGGPQPNRSGAVASEGDRTHNADLARGSLVFSGIKIGVLSDSIEDANGSYEKSKTTGDVPEVTILPGQSGGILSGEGLAMLEIVYDLVPGAQLYFATAFNGTASFAKNILDLRAAGCDVIIDDVSYFNESPFFDDVISQAVNAVSADGALYFSSAANSGSKKKNSSGTWVGDFKDGGVVGAPLTSPETSRVHRFTDSVTLAEQNFTAFPSSGSTGSSRRGDLFWSDPQGASTNDYDLFYLAANGSTVIRASTNVQNGMIDPYERFGTGTDTAFAGRRFVIVKAAAAEPRHLYLGSGRGILTISTNGQTKGHSTAIGGFGIAATPASAPATGGNPAFTPMPGPFPGPFNNLNRTEIFSSDGPRKFFFNPDGTPVTPGNFLATGGSVRLKPDFTAADGVSTTLPPTSGLNPFFGTSAAAPHAGAIAAILKAKNPNLTVAEVRSIFQTTAIDIEAAGYDELAGYGILDAQTAANAVTPGVGLSTTPAAVKVFSPSGNGRVDRNATSKLFVTVTNASGGTPATNVQAFISSSTPGVTVSTSPRSYGTIAPGASAENQTPFFIKTSSELALAQPITVTVNTLINGTPSATYELTLGTSFNLNPVALRSDYNGPPVVIPDNTVSGVNFNFPVSGVAAPVGKVTVSVFANESTFIGDLVITLRSPDNQVVTLVANVGDTKTMMGAGPADDQRVTFDDDATQELTDANVDTGGRFKPKEPLGTFSGIVPATANGTWILNVSDQGPADQSTFQVGSLFIQEARP